MITDQRNLLSELMTSSVTGEKLGTLDSNEDSEKVDVDQKDEKTVSAKEFRR